MTNPLEGVPRHWRWISYLVMWAIALTLFTAIMEILAGIFGWS
jgi:hypothetical protein